MRGVAAVNITVESLVPAEDWTLAKHDDAVKNPLEQTAVVKEAKMEALKSIAKNLLGMDLLEVKVAREKEAGRELTPDEQIELFEDEIRKVREAIGRRVQRSLESFSRNSSLAL